MMEIKEYKDQQEWDNLVLEKGGHPFQLWGWGEVKGYNDWRSDRIALLSKEKVVMMAQILTKKMPWPLKNFSYIPRAIVDSDTAEGFYNQIAKFVKEKYGSVVLSIEPHSFEKLDLKGWNRIDSNSSILVDRTVMIDLSQTEEQILASMGRKTRQSIHKAERNIDEIKQITTKEDLQKCLDIYDLTSQRAGFAIHSRKYYEKVFDELDSNSLIYGAYIDGELVGFLWLAISGSIAYQMYSGINEGGAKNRVNYALRWWSIKKVKEWGLKDYDFGGLMPGGVEAFKRAWSDKTTEFSGAYDKPLSIWYPLWHFGRPLANRLNQKRKALKRKKA